MRFGAPIVWWKPTNRHDDCDFLHGGYNWLEQV